jgi:hypothetical protein
MHVYVYIVSIDYIRANKNQIDNDRINCVSMFFMYISNSHWMVLTNIDSEEDTYSTSHCAEGYYNFGNSEAVPNSRNWLVYESFDSDYYVKQSAELQHILSMIFPLEIRVSSIKIKRVHVNKQAGQNDCGLFILAYIESLCRNLEPGLIIYDQNSLRDSYNRFVSSDFTILYFKYSESLKLSEKWFRKSTDHVISFNV